MHIKQGWWTLFSRGSLLRHAAAVACATLVSRLLGVLRDSALACLLGTSLVADALSAALRLPYLVRRMYGEGALSLELTAWCVRARHAVPNGDIVLARSITRLLIPLALLGFGLCVLAARPLLIGLTPGLAEPDAASMLGDAVHLFRLSALYIPAALLAAISMAVLHAREKFAVSSLTTALFNVIVLVFLAAAACGVSEPATLAALGVGVGGLAQWAAQFYAQRRAVVLTCSQVVRELPPDYAPWRIVRSLPLGVLVAATPQLTFLVAAALTSLLPEGSLSALFYAERLREFPLGVLGAALGLAAAPRLVHTLSEGASEDERSACLSSWTAERVRAVRMSLALNLPAAAGLMAVAVPLTDVIFGHGAFSASSVQATACVLAAYAVGLPAYGVSRPLLAACHGVRDRRMPRLSMVAGLLAALMLGALLMYPFGLAGPPLGAALALWIYALILGFGGRVAVWPQLQKVELAVCLAGSVLCYGVTTLCVRQMQSSLAALALAVPCGMLTYAAILGGYWLWQKKAGLYTSGREA